MAAPAGLAPHITWLDLDAPEAVLDWIRRRAGIAV